MKQAKLLTQAEQKRVSAIIDAHRYSARNHAIFAFSFFAGLRACEIAALKLSDVYEADGQVRDTIFLAAGQTKCQSRSKIGQCTGVIVPIGRV